MNVLDQFKLNGKVALITGGSRGLGLEMAIALSQAGAKVALMARREKYFAEARAELPDAHCVLGDVSNEADVIRAVLETKQKLGDICILVNAAGIAWGAPALEMPAEKFREVVQVNLDGTFYACKACAPDMIKADYGKIINIASIAGLLGEPPEILDAVGYSASKAGVIMLTKDLAAKWGRYGIRINAIAPGFFPTKMTEKNLPKIEQLIIARTPLGRVGHSGELAGAALYFASPASDYVTGQTLAVDGGTTV
jgi:NAD(P)-dependent dehydrogenase (short-subunit alcohol dehydrogenase family)